MLCAQGNPTTATAPFTPFSATAPKMTKLDLSCEVVETPKAKDAAYKALLEGVRAKEK